MTKNSLNSILAAAVILATALLSGVLTPRELMANANASLNLEAAVPHSFGIWRAIPNAGLVTPANQDYVESKELAAKIYSQEVGRTYMDNQGRAVMLMIAYGPVQDYRLKAHRPEVCYTAQGFQVSSKTDKMLNIRQASLALPIAQLITQRESRFEPVSYWMRVGHDISTGIFDNQLLRMKYGLRGLIPDGALVRVSTIGLPAQQSFELQEEFIRDLLSAVTPQVRSFLIGA